MKNKISKFKTPLTNFWIEDSEGSRVRFEIVENIIDNHEICIGNSITIVPNDYCDCRIKLKVSDFKLNTNYYLFSSSELEFRDADERVEIYGLTKNNVTLSIGLPEYNEGEKFKQGCIPQFERKMNSEEIAYFKSLNPNVDFNSKTIYDCSDIVYDESKFEICNFDYSKQPFRFTIFDHCLENIYIPIAWIKGIKDYMQDYEDACDNWVCTI